MVTIYIIWYKRDYESEWWYVTLPFSHAKDAVDYAKNTCSKYKEWYVKMQRVKVER